MATESERRVLETASAVIYTLRGQAPGCLDPECLVCQENSRLLTEYDDAVRALSQGAQWLRSR